VSDSDCLSCKGEDHRELKENTCVCKDEYFEKEGLCKECHHTCLTCIGESEESCTKCDISEYRILESNKCVC